ncbi:MAG: hypothetical protein ABW082_14960 [Sedimenticola sp.]
MTRIHTGSAVWCIGSYHRIKKQIKGYYLLVLITGLYPTGMLDIS